MFVVLNPWGAILSFLGARMNNFNRRHGRNEYTYARFGGPYFKRGPVLFLTTGWRKTQGRTVGGI